MTILTKSLKEGKKVFGLITKIILLTLLALTTCTCGGQKLMLGNQTLGNQTDYSLYSGKLAKQTQEATECVTLKTDDQDFVLWHHAESVNLATISTDSRLWNFIQNRS